MPTLDLGCGGNKRGDIGIDIAPWPGVDHTVQLGFEPLPLETGSIDRATCVHAIEHIPFCIWSVPDVGKVRRLYPMVQFLNEVYRVLKPGAEFEIITLSVKQAQGHVDFRMWQDPTHVSVWMPETIHHFVGARDSAVGNVNDELAGLRVPFELLRSDLNSDNLLCVVLRKPSNG
jgi:SAM-dependent methyltransferase